MRRTSIAFAALASGLVGCEKAIESPPSVTPKPTPTHVEAADPEVAWSEDGQFILWRSRDDWKRLLVARSSDFVPLRELNAFGGGFVGNWLAVEDDRGARLEMPEDGSFVATPPAPGLLDSALVTRSSVVVGVDREGLDLLTRATGAERHLDANLCSPGAELARLTPAAFLGDKIALDVECSASAIGAAPCTGARGNCESADGHGTVLDVTTGAFTDLEANFWAQVDVVSFSPDGRTIAILGQGQSDTLLLLDASTGRVKRSFRPADENEAFGLAACGTWTADSETFYLVTSSGVHAVAARTGTSTAFASGGGRGLLGLCRAWLVGDRLIIHSGAAVVRMRIPKLDTFEAREVTLNGELHVSPNGRWAVVRDDGETYDLVEAQTWNTIAPVPKTGTIAFDPTSTFVAVDRTVIELATGHVRGTLR